ncbi:MAG: vWA domain-containing protein [Myxococcota bacterium]
MRWWLGALSALMAMGCGSSTSPADTGTTEAFEACAEVQETASRVPVNLLLTIDRSGSMNDGDPVSKWDAMTSALGAFIESPEAEDLRVGLRWWPDADGCNNMECNTDACGMPQVDVGSLADVEQRTALLDEVAGTSPADEGGTPMSAALTGARDWAQDVQGAVPDEQVAIALLTDGIPNGCDETVDGIASIAEAAFTDGAPTYVMGIEGSREADVNQIALSGGTAQAFLVGSGNAEAELLEALVAIQGQALSCSYDFPKGAELDPAQIRIELDVDGMMMRLTRVADEASCTEDGFFLSKDGARITLCEATCTSLRETLDAEIDIAIGCVCETDDDCPDDETCEDNVCEPPPTVDDADPTAGRRVQGGATTCATSPSGAPWALAVGLLAVLRRRQNR